MLPVMRFAIVGLVLLAACSSSTSPYGGGGGGGGGGGHTTTIAVQNDHFSPTPDTVSAGSVTFSWATPSDGHNVTWDTGPGTLPANSATMTSGTYLATLVAGTYTFHCSIHGTSTSGMRGTIVVQ
jgi:plastocyanin